MRYAGSFFNKAKTGMQTASKELRKECFAILCVEAGGYAATGEFQEDALLEGLKEIAAEYGIAAAESILKERFAIGKRLPRHWPEFEERDVTITRKADNYVFFRAECECMSPNHCIEVIVDKADKDLPAVSASLITHCSWQDRTDSDSFWKLAWNRIKAACAILVNGELDVEGEFCIHGEHHLRDFADTLQAAIEHVEKRNP